MRGYSLGIKDAKTHIFRLEQSYLGERQILSELVQPGMKVLDVGCSATGRSARLLKEFGCDVYSIEINVDAIAEFNARADRAGIHLTVADMCTMPFKAGFFDLVLIAVHGVDYLVTDSLRIRAFQEISRILAKKGSLVFNSLNRAGMVFSPGAFRSKNYLISRIGHILKLGFMKPTLVDPNSLMLYQSLPSQVIRQVESSTDLDFVYAINPNGTSKNLLLLTLFSVGPYYVFSRQ